MPRNCAKIADSLIASIIGGINLPQHKAIYQAQNDYQDLGYRVFAPMIFGYYVWLQQHLKDFQADKILFFARDAHLIQQIHQIIYPQYDVDSEYIYLSRKSLYPLSLTDFPLWRLDFLVGSRSPRPLKTICTNYGLNIAELHSKMAQFGLQPETIITGENHHLATQFLGVCFEELIQISIANREQYATYFVDKIAHSQKVVIVDIGWAGNIQSAFWRIIQKQCPDTQLLGLYLGLNNGASLNLSSQNQMMGYFMNLWQNAENDKLIGQGGAELLEFVLTSAEGSTLGYQKNEQGIISPILEKKETQEQEYEQKALEVQKGVLAFVHDYAFLFHEFPLEALNSLQWTKPFCELVQNPSRGQISLLADLTHSDAAGSNQHRMPLAPKVSLFHRLFRTKTYRRAYENAFWKKGFYYRNQRDPKRYRG